MSTIIEYTGHKFILEEMTDADKAQLKLDKPQVWESLFGDKAIVKPVMPAP